MKKFLVLFAALCLLICMTACDNGTTGNAEPSETSTVAETTTAAATESKAVSVTVRDENGNPIQGVMLQICKDTCIPMVTDENGVASFNIEVTAEHKLSVLSCPEGYVYNGEPEMYLVEGVTEYEVELDVQ